jgi:subtilisin family serine protease
MSLGTLVDITTGNGAGDQAIFNRATVAAYNAGIVLVAAAGNDGFNLANQRYMEFPAQARDVLAVVASTNPACAENLKAGATCMAGPVTVPYYSNHGAPLNAVAAPGGSYPSGGAPDPATTASTESGWVTGACSSGKSSTLSGVPTDSAHSLGCFNLGHTAYVQAMGTSASAPLVAGAAALIIAAHPTYSPANIVLALRTSSSISSSLSTPQVNVTKLFSASH